MNAHGLRVLEFARVLDIVAGRASSPAGAARVRELAPSTERAWLESEHARVAAMRALVESEHPWSPEAIPHVDAALDRLRVEGTMLSGPELLGVGTLLRSSRLTRDALRDPRRATVATAVLATYIARLVDGKDVEVVLDRALDPDGNVRDEASPLLRRLRRELRGAQGELIKLLERIMSKLEPHQQVADMSVTVRDGRYVIPVRRDARAVVGGIVHDTSATGATLFVEPPAAVEAANRIREMQIQELREVERILRELSDMVRPHQPALVDALDALIALDALYARARFALEFRCSPSELCDPGEGFEIRVGRHPLLLAQGAPVVPFDLTMLPDERTLLVSGPNTGGKTVLLKAIGLMSALIQSGIQAPVGAGSRIAMFDDVFADIGDEQSIQASLSTFSAHLKNLGEILRAASDKSLVMIDELGSGTDPLEGAALGGAILEELTRRGTLTVATTHLGALKELASEVPGVVNASLEFDAVALAPTYNLLKGIPGRSYGLSIARRLNFPSDVLVRAEERVPRAERDVNILLADLEKRTSELADKEKLAAEVLDDARTRAARIADRERNVRNREQEVERAQRQDARRYLLDARQEVERTIKELRRASDDARDSVIRDARSEVERLAAEQQTALDRLDAEVARGRARANRDADEDDASTPEPNVKTGDVVELATLGGRIGTLLDIRDDHGVVAVGALKMTVPLDSLRRSKKKRAEPDIIVPIRGDMPEVHAPSEIDLRGMRIGEMDEILMQGLDAAVRADLRSLRIIHGKGTGALRDRVAEMLKKDTRVRTFRLGLHNEGGAGVTVAELE